MLYMIEGLTFLPVMSPELMRRVETFGISEKMDAALAALNQKRHLRERFRTGIGTSFGAFRRRHEQSVHSKEPAQVSTGSGLRS